MASKKKVATVKSNVKSLFDHLNEIYLSQRRNYFSTLTDADKRTYSVYMINRFLSMNVHQLPLVSEIQRYTLSPESHYLLCIGVIPRGKQYNKYVKSKTETKYEEWLVELVAKHYEVSKVEAITYIELYYQKNPGELREICESYGVESKLIKKVKL